MDTKKLRQRILDLAIRGKLVPQDPNDEPASVLLERIRAEKERLIKEGKIKRSKTSASDTPHYENVPFEVPESWEWTTIGKLCSFLSRGKSPKYSEERKYPVFAQKCNLYDGDISLEKARFLDPETISKWSDEYKLIDGDILVNSTGTGTVGRTRLFHSDVIGDYPFVVPDSHVSVVRTFEEIESKFVLAFLLSDYGQTYIEDNLAGSTNQKELYIGILDNMLFPLPPQEEQLRIVTAIDKWFSLINVLESAKGDLQTSIAQAKSKILDLAIHGKLVPQDPNDEPAIELLKRINPKFTPCDNAHCQYGFPIYWELAKLEDICEFIRNGVSVRQIKGANGLPITRIETISNGVVDRDKMGYADINDDTYEKYYLQNGDILMSHINSPIHVGKSALYESIEGEKIIHGMNLLCLRMKAGVFPKYMNNLFTSDFFRDEIRPYIKNAVNQASINTRNLGGVYSPIPPYNEQQRIVTKIEELFAVLDKIQKSIGA